jgi:hypothetical protein
VSILVPLSTARSGDHGGKIIETLFAVCLLNIVTVIKILPQFALTLRSA